MSKPARIPAAARADALAPKLARQVVKQRIEAAIYYWQRVARHDKPPVEDIHQLRVWSRRAMAATQLFAPLLAAEPAAELLAILNKARKRAGKARDCDVLLKTLDANTRKLLDEALQELKKGRAESAEKLRRSYRKKVRSGDLQEWSKALQKQLPVAGDNGHASPPLEFGSWFLQQFAVVAAPFLKQLRPAKPLQRRIHPLRIEGKRVRYALEIGLPSLPKQAGKQLYAALENLQEQLGAICDDQALAAQYRELAAGLKSKQQARLLQQAAQHERQELAGFAKFSRWWRAANGRKKLLQHFAAILTPPEVADLSRAKARLPAQRRKRK
jgi:CHAD domain-containing protein